MTDTSTQPTILILHSHEIVRQSLAKIMQAQGFHVECSHDALQALCLLNQQAITQIWLGQDLATLTAYEWVNILNMQDDMIKPLKIVLILEQESLLAREKAKLCGITHCLVQPWTSDDVRLLLTQ
ncbi:MAG: hypothetical protein Q4D05_01395 [Acinetobacter sp.]|nr:hypothetical protein [Acinetobacter sp.]